MRRRAAALAAITLTLAGLAMVPARADDPSGADAVAACRQSVGQAPEAGGRGCRSVEQLTWDAGTACRQATSVDCTTADGRHISPAAVAAYQSSWVHQALALQRALDDSRPLSQELWLHTHNSFNSAAYRPTVSGLDPNQRFSMPDQLSMDVRAIEIDVHWAPSAEGDPAFGGRAPVMCHAQTGGSPPATVHPGCSYERTLRHGLAEIRGWLAQPGHQDEVIMLYLENALDRLPEAHAAAASAIEAELGPLVYRPSTPCAGVPVSTSRAAIRATGARVLIVGNCGPGAWGTWVHERDIPGRWNEAGSGPGDDYPASCGAERAAFGYGTRLIRRYEDSTWLSAMVGTGGQLTATEAGRMVRCGVNLVGFDQLGPDDARLAASIWSWAPGQPATGAGDCAATDDGGRMVNRPCDQPHRFACFDGSSWTVSAVSGAFGAGGAACGLGRTFSVPWNGWESTRLAAVAGGEALWIAYRQQGDAWVPVG